MAEKAGKFLKMEQVLTEQESANLEPLFPREKPASGRQAPAKKSMLFPQSQGEGKSSSAAGRKRQRPRPAKTGTNPVTKKSNAEVAEEPTKKRRKDTSDDHPATKMETTEKAPASERKDKPAVEIEPWKDVEMNEAESSEEDEPVKEKPEREKEDLYSQVKFDFLPVGNGGGGGGPPDDPGRAGSSRAAEDAEVKKALAAAQTKINGLMADNAALDKRIREYKKQLSDVESTNTKLIGETSRQTTLAEVANKNAAEMRANIDLLNIEKKAAEKARELAESSLESKEEELEAALQDKETLEKKLKLADTNLKKITSENTDFETKNSELDEQLKKLRTAARELQEAKGRIAELEGKVVSVESGASTKEASLQTELKAFKTQRDDFETKYKAIESAKLSLEGELAVAKNATQKANSRAEAEEKERKLQAIQFAEEKADLDKQIRVSEQKIKELRNEVSAERSAKTSADIRKSEADGLRQTAESEAQTLRQQLEGEKKTRERLSSENDRKIESLNQALKDEKESHQNELRRINLANETTRKEFAAELKDIQDQLQIRTGEASTARTQIALLRDQLKQSADVKQPDFMAYAANDIEEFNAILVAAQAGRRWDVGGDREFLVVMKDFLLSKMSEFASRYKNRIVHLTNVVGKLAQMSHQQGHWKELLFTRDENQVLRDIANNEQAADAFVSALVVLREKLTQREDLLLQRQREPPERKSDQPLTLVATVERRPSFPQRPFKDPWDFVAPRATGDSADIRRMCDDRPWGDLLTTFMGKHYSITAPLCEQVEYILASDSDLFPNLRPALTKCLQAWRIFDVTMNDDGPISAISTQPDIAQLIIAAYVRHQTVIARVTTLPAQYGWPSFNAQKHLRRVEDALANEDKAQELFWRIKNEPLLLRHWRYNACNPRELLFPMAAMLFGS